LTGPPSDILAAYAMGRQYAVARWRTGPSLARPAADRSADDRSLHRLTARAAVLRQGRRNADHVIGMIETADGALAVISSTIQEMLPLVQRAGSGGYTAAQQAGMQAELDELVDRIDGVAGSVRFGGRNLLDGDGGTVMAALGEADRDPAVAISVRTADMTAEGLGLTGDGVEATAATLTADSAYNVASPSDTYLRGPKQGPPAELTITFHGSEGDKAVTLEIKKNKSLTDIVEMVNTDSQALVAGWDAAEAVEVGGQWGLKLTSYEAGQADAPTVAVAGDLNWQTKDPVQPSHFAGVAGTDEVGSGPLAVAAATTAQRLADAIAAVDGYRAELSATLRRLASAGSALELAEGVHRVHISSIADPEAAMELSQATASRIVSDANLALLLQADLSSRTALYLLGFPERQEQSGTFSMLV